MTLQEQALALSREVGDLPGVARGLTFLGVAVMLQGDSQRAAALFEEGLTLVPRQNPIRRSNEWDKPSTTDKVRTPR